jgi:hypothetical protein
MQGVSVNIVRSIEELVSTVRELRKQWKLRKHQELWFRAEDALHRNTHLQPGLYRTKEGTVRKSVTKLLEIENELYEEFRRCEPQLSGVNTNGDYEEWDSYFLMQHHGVPTRLLDWSDGALIALHFAIREKPVPPKSGSIIYVLDPHWLVRYLKELPDRKDAENRWQQFWKKNPLDVDENDWDRLYLPSDEKDMQEPLLATPKIPVLFDSPHLTRRVAAQRSRFMIFGTDPLWLARIAQKNDSHLIAMKIPVSSISTIKQELRDAGITESVVFPDLDGLGRELRQVWSARR